MTRLLAGVDCLGRAGHHVLVSFDLDALAIDPTASDEEVHAMAKRCGSGQHPEGELDRRIVSFYERLRAAYPDCPPDGDSPWMLTPLDVGIDHVRMSISFGKHGTSAIELILNLADQHGLTIYDRQSDVTTRPHH